MFTTTRTLAILVIVSALDGVYASPCAAQTTVTLTLNGSGIPPGPLDVFPTVNPVPPETYDLTLHSYQLAGLNRIPQTAQIQQICQVISSGIFSGTIFGGFRSMITDGNVRFMGMPIDQIRDPNPGELLEVYGVGQYASGGGECYVNNPISGSPWTWSDLSTYGFGFWSEWSNTSTSALQGTRLSFSDYHIDVTYTGPSVTVTTADIVNDVITIVMSPSGLSGNLVVTAQGGASQTIFNGSASGTINLPFGRTTLPIGQYTTVVATWSPGGTAVSGSKSVAFYVMGSYLHTQYNSPNESACTGKGASAYITNSSCVFNSVKLKSDFISQSWLNGSGITIKYGSEQNESFCLAGGPKDDSGRSFRPQAIVPSCGSGYSVNNTTVARGDDAPLVCGDSVVIVGLGGAQTVKEVTDLCPACTGKMQLDNYTTQAFCQVGSIPSLGTFTTIRLR